MGTKDEYLFRAGMVYARIVKDKLTELFCTENAVRTTNREFSRLSIGDVTDDGLAIVYFRFINSPFVNPDPRTGIEYRAATDDDIRNFLYAWPLSERDGMFRWVDRIQRRTEVYSSERARILRLSEEFQTVLV